jgi:hypothetical protein
MNTKALTNRNNIFPTEKPLILSIIILLGLVSTNRIVLADDGIKLNPQKGNTDRVVDSVNERDELLAKIRKKYRSPWSLSDKMDDGVAPDVLRAISIGAIREGQLESEIVTVFGKDSFLMIEGKLRNLMVIPLGRSIANLKDVSEKDLRQIEMSGESRAWNLFVYIKKSDKTVSDILLRYGTFNKFDHMKGVLLADPPALKSEPE